MRRMLIVAAFLVLAACRDFFGPETHKFPVAVYNRTADTLLIVFNGRETFPLLAPGRAKEYFPEIIVEGQYESYYLYGRRTRWATLHAAARNIRTGELSRPQTLAVYEDEVARVVFDEYDFWP